MRPTQVVALQLLILFLLEVAPALARRGQRGASRRTSSHDKKLRGLKMMMGQQGMMGKKNNCFGEAPLVFEDVSTTDYFEGDATQFGQRVIWFGDVVNDMEGNHIGDSTGICTVVAEAQSSKDGHVHEYCDVEYNFFRGPWADSNLLFSGQYSFAGIGNYTITGGTGCFARAAGQVNQVLTTSESPWIFQGVIVLE